jgi:long-chain acyl-CoA synthetase
MARRGAYPAGVPFSVNYPEMPLHGFLENSARKFPGRTATIFLGARASYGQLWDQSMRLGGCLRGLGVGKGDRVGLLLPNTPHFIVALNAVSATGGIVVPVSPLNPAQEIGRELEETEVSVLIALDRLLDRLPEGRPGRLVVAEAAAYAPARLQVASRLQPRRTPSGALIFEELVRAEPPDEIPQIEARKDVAVILYTSGTTGQPKGVMLTHYNLVANALQSYHWLRGWGYSRKPQPAGWPVILCAVPFFHSYGLNVLEEALSFGCTLALVPDPKPEAIMAAIQETRATHFPAIPRFVREVLGHPALAKHDLTSLTSCSVGGASIEQKYIDEFAKVTGARLYLGYGLTEAGPSTHGTPVDGEPNLGSVGLAFPDTEAKIVDLQLGEVDEPSGGEGELVLRGPQVMKGYWRAPGETARVLRGGWLHTGDVARIDEDGYLYILGRKRDRIVAAGRTVWPVEVEEALLVFPGVEAAVAVGTPDPLRCSTDLQAFVVLGQGVEREGVEERLMDHCRVLLEPYKVPGVIEVVKSLPQTQMGKVDRLAVEAQLEERVKEFTEGARKPDEDHGVS